MAYRTEHDFAYCEPLRDALMRIRKHKGRIIDFDPNGPGSGNPLILLEFHRHSDALAFLTEMEPAGVDKEFLKTLISKVP